MRATISSGLTALLVWTSVCSVNSLALPSYGSHKQETHPTSAQDSSKHHVSGTGKPSHHVKDIKFGHHFNSSQASHHMKTSHPSHHITSSHSSHHATKSPSSHHIKGSQPSHHTAAKSQPSHHAKSSEANHHVKANQPSHGIKLSQPSHHAKSSDANHHMKASQPSHGIKFNQPSHHKNYSLSSHHATHSQPSHAIKTNQPSYYGHASHARMPIKLSQPSNPIRLNPSKYPIKFSQPSRPVNVSRVIGAPKPTSPAIPSRIIVPSSSLLPSSSVVPSRAILLANSAILSSSVIPSSSIAPVPSPSPTNLGPCGDLRQNLSPACWDELDITGYMATWWAQNQADCGGYGFASCYQQKAGVEQQQCDSTGPSLCSYPESFIIGNYTPQQAYVLYTIFGIWQWFESLYLSIENADVTAQGPVGNIIRLFNPPKKNTESLGLFLQALTAIAPVISVPASLGAWGLFKVSGVIETALRQSPGVLHQLNPTGTLDSQFDELTNIYDGLSIVKSTYQQNISTALTMVQRDFQTFSNFAAHGAFIAPRTALQAQTVNMTNNLQTFVTAQALTQSNIIVTMARDTDPHALATNGSLQTPSLMDCSAYDQYGLCGEWWWDRSTNTAYALSSVTDPGKKFHDMLETVFSNGWTTGEDLFLGARSCADYVAAAHVANTPVLDPSTFLPHCISNTQVCVYDMSCAINDANCLYTSEYGGGNLCKPPSGYLSNGCQGNSDGTYMTFNVPAAYLGPVDWYGNPMAMVCTG